MLIPKSPRIVPALASLGLVLPIISLVRLMALSPSIIAAVTVPDVINAVSYTHLTLPTNREV